MNPRFALRLDRDAYAPGDVVRGSIEVQEGGRSRSLEAFLEFHEESDDYARLADSVGSGPLHSGDLEAGATFTFELQLPAGALPSHRSRHGELWWEVDVRSDELGRDTHERRRITVVPARD